jgi:asparagine synthase (glutamine-hydrolysing)
VSGVCGICFRSQAEQVHDGQLLPMVRSLDVAGYSDGSSLVSGRVGMGVQSFPGRLTGVAQRTSQGQVSILAFHGNIYNLKELIRAETPDFDIFAELFLLYLNHGIDFVQQLRGEFALAVWDAPNQILYLVTDRFRVHPIFYYHDNKKLVFASRMKGILACPLPIRRTVNPEAIIDVIASSFVPTQKTIFREVQKLPPGHILAYKSGETRLMPYWEVSFLQPNKASETELARELKTHFDDAVSVRLRVDESHDRIGTFLSGGVDSSTVTAVISQKNRRPVHSFSIGFGEEQFNEIRYARIAARAFSSDHHEYFVTAQDTYDAIPVLLESFDEPFANASAIPTYFCAKLAKDHGVNVLYAGDGGDELFAGNERYAFQRLFEYYGRLPFGLRERILKPVVFLLAERLRWNFFIKGQKYIRRASIPYPERLSSYGFFKVVPIADFIEDELLKLVGEDYDPYALVNCYYHHAPARSELDRQLYVDLKLAISDNDIFKVTRATEAVGATVRFPFLDQRLAEFATTVPSEIRMRGRNLRSFFKNAYADLLPIEILKKTKHGFGLPIPVWLRTDKRLNDLMHDLVLSPKSLQRGYFRKKVLEQIIELHKTDPTSFYGAILWNLMILELWHRRYT